MTESNNSLTLDLKFVLNEHLMKTQGVSSSPPQILGKGVLLWSIRCVPFPFIYSLNTCLMSTYHMPHSIMDAKRVGGSGQGGRKILADKQSNNKTKQSKTETTDELFP